MVINFLDCEYFWDHGQFNPELSNCPGEQWQPSSNHCIPQRPGSHRRLPGGEAQRWRWIYLPLHLLFKLVQRQALHVGSRGLTYMSGTSSESCPGSHLHSAPPPTQECRTALSEKDATLASSAVIACQLILPPVGSAGPKLYHPHWRCFHNSIFHDRLV